MDVSNLASAWQMFTEILKWGVIALIPASIIMYFTGHLQRILVFVYGELSRSERNKFISYGALFFVIIGIYWLLRCIKDPTFSAFVDSTQVWKAKIVSLLVVFPLVAGYNYLVDKFSRHRLFYAMSAIYAVILLVLWFFVRNECYGLPAAKCDRWSLLGWIAYVVIESFGSLMVVLFYSFMADTTTPEAGKKGFFVTQTFAQLGAIFGSQVVASQSENIGVDKLYVVAAVVIAFAIPAIVRFIMWYIPKEELAGYQAKGAVSEGKKKTGFVEGIAFLLSQPYLLGIFVVVSAFEVVVTVFDLQFKVLIQDYAKGNPNVFGSYTGEFGVYVSVLALASLLLGIGKIGRKIGLTISLALMPLMVLVMIFTMQFIPVLGVVFWVMVFAKGINYALGQPSKEQLYIPTSREAKYKSKAWVDTFGSRFAKASGSGIIGLHYSWLALPFLAISGINIVICVAWFFTAFYLGRKHKHAVEHNEVVC